MKTFSNDVDILKYEPGIFADPRFDQYLITKGSGATLTGGILTCTNENFNDLQIRNGQVVHLFSGADSTLTYLEILEVISATQLKVSLMRVDESCEQIIPNNLTNRDYRITCFDPLVYQVLVLITSYFGIRPGNPTSGYDVDDIVDDTPLKQISVYGTLSLLFERLNAATIASLENASVDSNSIEGKAIHYRWLYEKARESCVFCVQSPDGINSRRIRGGSFKLSRG